MHDDEGRIGVEKGGERWSYEVKQREVMKGKGFYAYSTYLGTDLQENGGPASSIIGGDRCAPFIPNCSGGAG